MMPNPIMLNMSEPSSSKPRVRRSWLYSFTMCSGLWGFLRIFILCRIRTSLFIMTRVNMFRTRKFLLHVSQFVWWTATGSANRTVLQRPLELSRSTALQWLWIRAGIRTLDPSVHSPTLHPLGCAVLSIRLGSCLYEIYFTVKKSPEVIMQL